LYKDSNIETSIEKSLILTLFDVVNFLTKNGEAMAHEGGLTVQQWLVLLQIANDPGFPNPDTARPGSVNTVLASEIATARGVSRSNISALLATLLRKRLVRQLDDPNDRRRKRLSITSKGEKALKQIEPLRHRFNSDLFADFNAGEIQLVQQFLRRCLEKLWHLNSKRENQTDRDNTTGTRNKPRQ